MKFGDDWLVALQDCPLAAVVKAGTAYDESATDLGTVHRPEWPNRDSVTDMAFADQEAGVLLVRTSRRAGTRVDRLRLLKIERGFSGEMKA